ncbi:MAG: hypothetical protein ACREX9_21155 [Gammaproteobacteria bacterium]
MPWTRRNSAGPPITWTSPPIPTAARIIGNALTEDLHQFGDPQVLFMLDNCHLDEPLAKELALSWEDLAPAQRPRLLLLGRELRTGRGSPIDGFSIPTLALKAQQPEVLGVYRRLAWRHTGEAAPLEPPPEVLDKWVLTFGGDPASPDTTTDLIAFSAAVLRRIRALLKRDWTLHVSDAIEEIRTAYLDKLSESEGETRNLMRLCVTQELEVGLGEQALADPRAGFKQASRRLGLVFRHTTGASQQWIRYRLAHAALSDLILAAAYEPVDRVSERRTAALQNPHGGAAMVARLAAVGAMDEGRELASAMLGEPECPLEVGSLSYMYLFLRSSRRLEVSLPHDLGQILTSEVQRERLVDRALQTSLGHLESFLKYATQTDELKPVFAALAHDLSCPKNHPRLVESAFQTSLDALASFLEYAAPKLKPVFTALADDLARPEKLGPLVDRALLTPLSDLQSFLIFAADSTKLRPVFKSLIDGLSVSATRRQLARRFENARLDSIVAVLSAEVTSELWDSVFADVDADAWARSRANDSETKLDAFVTFQRLVGEKGRPELAGAGSEPRPSLYEGALVPTGNRSAPPIACAVLCTGHIGLGLSPIPGKRCDPGLGRWPA